LAVVIRLARQGRKHAAFYRITVADSRRAATGKFLAQIGWFNPHAAEAKVHVDEPNAIKWMQNGAQPTESVRSLFHKLGIMEKYAEVRRGKKPENVVTVARPETKRKPKVHKKAKEAAAKAAAAAPAAA
jgi:small subunit ribosomal protein S16